MTTAIRHSYTFQTKLFDSSDEVAQYIARKHVMRMIASDEKTDREYVEEFTDEELADDAIETWGLDEEWLQVRGLTPADMVRAFKNLRVRIAEEPEMTCR